MRRSYRQVGPYNRWGNEYQLAVLVVLSAWLHPHVPTADVTILQFRAATCDWCSDPLYQGTRQVYLATDFPAATLLQLTVHPPLFGYFLRLILRLDGEDFAPYVGHDLFMILYGKEHHAYSQLQHPGCQFWATSYIGTDLARH
jgi:hypothetical protein